MLTNYVLALAALGLFDRVTTRSGLESSAGFMQRRPDRPKPRLHQVRWRGWLIAAGLLLVGWIGLSLALDAREPARPTVRVAAIQPKLPRAAHRDTATPATVRLAALAAQTREAAGQGAQIIVWPEMALGFDPQVEHAAELAALAVETGAYLVIGYVVEGAQGFWNEATVLTPGGDLLGVYGKTHPMIASGEPKTITAGTYRVYDTALGRLATLICFDDSFTNVARRLARDGAQLLANPSLFGRSIAHATTSQVIFRAIENHAAVVMADVAFNSAIVDAYGRIRELAITPQGEARTLVADVPLGTGGTLYARLGDWLGWLSLAGMIAFAIAMTVTARRIRRAQL